jgi:hypothetical protein
MKLKEQMDYVTIKLPMRVLAYVEGVAEEQKLSVDQVIKQAIMTHQLVYTGHSKLLSTATRLKASPEND